MKRRRPEPAVSPSALNPQTLDVQLSEPAGVDTLNFERDSDAAIVEGSRAKLFASRSKNDANDNPWIESVWGRLKTEIEWKIIEAPPLEELEEMIDEHFEYSKEDRRKSSFGNTPPNEHLKTLSTNAKIAAPN